MTPGKGHRGPPPSALAGQTGLTDIETLGPLGRFLLIKWRVSSRPFSKSQTAYISYQIICMNEQLKWLWLSLKKLVKPWVESKVFLGGFGPSGFQMTLLSDGAILSVTYQEAGWCPQHCHQPSHGRDTMDRKGTGAEDTLTDSTEPSPAASSTPAAHADTEGDSFLVPKLSIPHRLSDESQAPTCHYSAARWRNGGWSMGVSQQFVLGQTCLFCNVCSLVKRG